MKKFFLIAVVGALLICGCEPKKSAEDYITVAVQSAKVGDWQACDSNCDKVLASMPDNVSVLTLKSIALNALGDKVGAKIVARKAVELEESSYPARYMYGMLLSEEAGQEQAAIDELVKALRMSDSGVNNLLLLVQATSAVNDDITDLYLGMLPSDYLYRPEIATHLGVFYALRNKTVEAGQSFADAFYQAPNNPAVVLNYARFLDYYGSDPINAIARYQQYLDLTANNPELNSVRNVVEGRITALRR